MGIRIFVDGCLVLHMSHQVTANRDDYKAWETLATVWNPKTKKIETIWLDSMIAEVDR
jgi:hypothetical protein